MCFHTSLNQPITALENHYHAQIEQAEKYTPQNAINGFAHPEIPVLTHQNPGILQHFYWGLIPFWAKDNSIQRYTLNAKIETLHEKPSFKNVVQNRCLVPVDGFYEWQWQDPKGQKKKKYRIHLSSQEFFSLGGLWSQWTDKKSGEIIHSFTIVTTAANELMSKIHNHKKRMPIILSADQEKEWLNNERIEDFKVCDPPLEAVPV